jgi:hypothetical protein
LARAPNALARKGYVEDVNPLAEGYVPVTDADPGLFGRVMDWVLRQQQISQERGLWTGGQVWQGGHPTTKGVADAAQQYAGNFEGGIKAFHGSPHSFERFDLSKIGTGEGAQAYGHGLYFAENEGVARGYRDQLRGDPTIDGQPVDWGNPAEHAAAVVAGYNGSRNAAIRDLAGQVASLRNQKGWNEASDPTAAALRYLQAGHELPPVTQPPGHMYEVDINADPDRMLHWDKPLSEQHPDVQRALQSIHSDKVFTAPDAVTQLDNGRYVLTQGGNVVGRKDGWPSQSDAQYVLKMLQDDAAKNSKLTGGDLLSSRTSSLTPEGHAQALREAGIPGIRYLDQGSRGKGEGTHNVVVFDANTIDILRKYGIAGLGIGLGAAATQGE